MLDISGLHVSYHGSAAISGIDLHVPKGELVAVIGPNGAGKSTLLRTISGINRPTHGSIIFDGQDITSAKPDHIVRTGIVHVPEGRMVLGRMSVRDNLLLGAFPRPAGTDIMHDFAAILELFPRLGERLDQLAGSLSGGEQQMLAIGRGLMAKPKLLMLDEPSLGLAPIIVQRIFEVLDEIRKSGVTILLVEQNAYHALAAAKYGYVLDLGRVAASGLADRIASDPIVRKAYLGM